MDWRELLASQLLIVSGKGGTGKSTVAAAIAAAAAAAGRRTLLAEVEGRGEIARTLLIPEPGYAEEGTPFGFGALSVSPREAALEYLRTYYGMGAVSRPLARSGALDQVIGGAPGFRDLLVCGKLYELSRAGRESGRGAGPPRPVYDLIVVDGPPTGQLAAFLDAPRAYAQVFRVGRMRRHATSVAQLMARRAGVVVVALPEQMAVTETLEAIPAVEAAGVRVAAIVVNRWSPPVFPAGTGPAARRLTPDLVVRSAGRAGLTLDVDGASSLLEGAKSAEQRRRSQEGFVRRLRRAGPPVLSLDEVVVTDPAERVRALAAAISGHGADASAGYGSPRAGRAAATASRAAIAPGPGDAGLDGPLADARVVVVCGSGGVGKTTVSAAIAVELARRGRRTVLLTVDPARRLATTLSLPSEAGDRTTLRVGRGRTLEAMQLDTQRTFDELVARFAPGPAARDRILANGFYRRIADTLGGTHEYMAMERLHQLAEDERHEAIVIDTPPTRSALSLLDAPRRLTDFLGGRFLRWMLLPSARAGRITLSAARVGATAFLRTAGRLVGAEVLADTAEFLSDFEGMFGGFRRRAAEVTNLLGEPSTAFLVVAVPTDPSLDEAALFLERLGAGGMHAAAVVLNRVRTAGGPVPRGSERAAATLASGGVPERSVAALIGLRLRERAVEAQGAEALQRFRSRRPGAPVVRVPELDGDVHDVAGLRRLQPFLFGAEHP